MATAQAIGIVNTKWDKSANRDVFKTLVKERFNSTDGKALVEYKDYVKNLTTTDDYERIMRIAGLGPMRAIVEGQGIPLDEPAYGGVKEFTLVRFGNGFRITDRMKRFNKINIMKMLTTSLKKTMLEGTDIEVAKMWNNPTATTYASGFDGLALGHDTHTTLADNGQTYDNYLNLALSKAALEAAHNYFDAVYDDKGNIMVRQAKTLMVNKALRFTADELMKSPNVAFEMSSTKNVLPDLKIKVYHRLSSATAWNVLGDVDDDMYGPRVYTAVAPDLETKDAPDRSRDTEVTSHTYFVYGFTDPRLVVVGQA